MTADTTMTDVDTSKEAVKRAARALDDGADFLTEESGGDDIAIPDLRNGAAMIRALSSRYDELKKLQNVTSELWQSAERERDELERLAGDALAELEADLKVITHAFAEIDKLPMNGELIGLHSILLHSKDKRIPRIVSALSALGDPAVVAEALPELVDAAEDMTLIWRQDGEGYSEHADRVAEVFRKETGLMAPGKDAGLVGVPAQQAMRQQRYDEWWEARGKRFLDALAKLKARP